MQEMDVIGSKFGANQHFEYIEMFYNRVRRHSAIGYENYRNFPFITHLAVWVSIIL